MKITIANIVMFNLSLYTRDKLIKLTYFGFFFFSILFHKIITSIKLTNYTKLRHFQSCVTFSKHPSLIAPTPGNVLNPKGLFAPGDGDDDKVDLILLS